MLNKKDNYEFPFIFVLAKKLNKLDEWNKFVDSEKIKFIEDSTGSRVGTEEDEEDMLDSAFDLRDNSRLSCQIIMSEELDGLKLSLAQNEH